MAIPKVTLTAGTAPVEGGAIGTYLITLDQAAPVSGLTVNFNVSGSASFGIDYNFTAGTNVTAVTANNVTIAQDQTSAILNVTAVMDSITDPNETIGFSIQAAAGYQLELGVPNIAAYLTITDTPNIIPTFIPSNFNINILANAAATDIKSLLNVSDTDPNQTETWFLDPLNSMSAPRHGTVDFVSATAASGSTSITSGGSITYTPTTGFVGLDSFAVTVSDGVGGKAIKYINANVTDTAPIFVPSNFNINILANAAATDIKSLLNVSDTDPNQMETWFLDPLNSMSAPRHGTVDFVSATAASGSTSITSGGSITYTPTTGFVGLDSFAVTVSDGVGGKAIKYINANVTDTAPIFVPSNFNINILANAAATDIKSLLNVSDTDPNQMETWFLDPLNSMSAPRHGTVDFVSATAASGSTSITSGGSITYTPTTGFVGLDSFAVTVSDGVGGKAIKYINANVTDTAPIFVPSNFNINILANAAATDIKSLLNVSDTDPNQMETWFLDPLFPSNAPRHGTLDFVSATAASGSTNIASAGSITYTPTTGYVGLDTFAVTVSDGVGGKASKYISVNVTDTAPTFIPSNIGINILANAAATDIKSLLNVSDTDPNQTETWFLDPLFPSNAPRHGTLDFVSATAASGSTNIASAGSITYTPTTGYVGLDTFAVTVSDGVGGKATKYINVNVTDTAPTGADKTIALLEDHDYNFTAADFGYADVDGNAMASIKIIDGGLSLWLNDGVQTPLTPLAANSIIPLAAISQLVFTPSSNSTGDGYGHINFTVNDGSLDSVAVNTITINMTPVNDAPLASSNIITLLEDNSYKLTAADFGFTDANDSPANNLANIIITRSPVVGALTLGGVAVTLNQVIPVASLSSLSFTPVANTNGTAYASFGFKVQDNGGTANGGIDTSVIANTISFNVTAVNNVSVIGGATTVTNINDTAITTPANATGGNSYIVNSLADVITEQAGNGWDVVTSNMNNYTLPDNVEVLILGASANAGTGNAQNNYLLGNAQANTIDGGAGDDVMAGYAGDDNYNADSSNINADWTVNYMKGDIVVEAANEGTDTVNANVSYALRPNIENLVLTGNAIAGFGNDSDNTITGNAADNVISGGAGADVMIGGAGNDIYFVDNSGDVTTEVGSEGTDMVYSTASDYTLGVNVENLVLWGAALNGTGNAGDNIMFGNALNNTLVDGAGSDVLVGGDGADTYNMSVDNTTDTLYIGAGDSLVTSYDKANNFNLGGSTGADNLNLPTTLIAADTATVGGTAVGSVTGASISNGIISFTGLGGVAIPATALVLSDALAYIQANIINGNTVAFVAGSDTFVFQDAGDNDTLIDLVGVTATSVNTTGVGAGAVWIM